MHVNCGCNGENCKINIARVIFGLRLKSALLLIVWAVGIFALQLLNIMVYIFKSSISGSAGHLKMFESFKQGCTALLFYVKRYPTACGKRVSFFENIRLNHIRI